MQGLPGTAGQQGLREHLKAYHWCLEIGLEYWVEGAVSDVVYLMERAMMVRVGEEEATLEGEEMVLEEVHTLGDIVENQIGAGTGLVGVDIGVGEREAARRTVPICIVVDWVVKGVVHVGSESHCFPVSVYLLKAVYSSLRLGVVGRPEVKMVREFATGCSRHR